MMTTATRPASTAPVTHVGTERSLLRIWLTVFDCTMSAEPRLATAARNANVAASQPHPGPMPLRM